MLELYIDKIDITKSKKEKKLIYQEHSWWDEINIPLFFIMPAIIWFYFSIRAQFDTFHNPENYLIDLIAFPLLVIGIYWLYKNIQSRKIQSIRTNLSIEENRRIILLICEQLNIQFYKNNEKLLVGLYCDSFPFNQIVTIMYSNNVILFNSRNVCLGYIGKLGRPPFGYKASKKLYQQFKKKIDMNLSMQH